MTPVLGGAAAGDRRQCHGSGHAGVRRLHQRRRRPSSDPRRSFVGLEVPPIVTSDLPGREFVLHADDFGSLNIGSLVFYRHISAGQVVAYELDPGGASVTIKVFVNSPFDAYVTAATRFWQASGIDMSINSDGVKLHTESLASILEGGVAFEPLPAASSRRRSRRTRPSRCLPDRERAMREPKQRLQPSSCTSKALCADCRPARRSICMASRSEKSRSVGGVRPRCRRAALSGGRGFFSAANPRRRGRMITRAAPRGRAMSDAASQLDRQSGGARHARRIQDRQSADRTEIRGSGHLQRPAPNTSAGTSSPPVFPTAPVPR